MFLEASTLQALAIAGGVGGLLGLIGGFVGSADNLLGTLLVGIIGGIVASSILRIAGAPPIYSVGAEEFSLVWAGVGGLVLGFAIARSNA